MQRIRLTSMEGRKRALVDRVYPEIDAGAFPIKRVVGDPVTVEADIIADGHELLQGILLYRKLGKRGWSEIAMEPLGNDRYSATFTVEEIGGYEYTVSAWVDHFETWRSGLEKKHAAAVDAGIDLQIGAALVAEAVDRATGKKSRRLQELANIMVDENGELNDRVEVALSKELYTLMKEHPDRRFASDYPRILRVWVDRQRAAFSSWYEMFPRSTSDTPGLHGTFKDAEGRLPYIAEMGFDVVYLPPIHPIGETNRKGRNNSLTPSAADPGSPWAIGNKEGGHKSIHPELGTEEDFKHLVRSARSYGMEIALDIAFQCSPDHPWVTEHPEWFTMRPDGTIQYAENPPKKYEDIYPINFESENWRGLWKELYTVFEHWINLGVTIFRVDNPHTKSFLFWEWLCGEMRENYPEVLLLAEAFTRPKRMYRLAKIGYAQSYTYFTWRNSPGELREYLKELAHTEVKEFFRPNFWPNTPDILHEDLQNGFRSSFMARLALAATLSSNYGIYGPAFELMEHEPRERGSEEYKNSEKYEIRYWDLDAPHSLAPFIAKINRIRRENPALQRTDNIRFHNGNNDQLLCYSKSTGDKRNVLLIVVNMDYRSAQEGSVEFSPAAVGLPEEPPFWVHDLLTDVRYQWQGYWNFVRLDPFSYPVHIFRVER
ncbi:MAG: alpha-1,4-glucan--maltose-1-phosphate maltosyltransferase [Spirochaetaceae bacterium]